MTNLTRSQFTIALTRALSPSRPIQSPEHLKGREDQIDGINKALMAVGRQIFIYGHMGVGKTSLAHTVSFQHQSSDNDPILLSCGGGVTFYTIIKDLFEKALPDDPRVIERASEGCAEFQRNLINSEGVEYGGSYKRDRDSVRRSKEPGSVNDRHEVARR